MKTSKQSEPQVLTFLRMEFQTIFKNSRNLSTQHSLAWLAERSIISFLVKLSMTNNKNKTSRLELQFSGFFCEHGLFFIGCLAFDEELPWQACWAKSDKSTLLYYQKRQRLKRIMPCMYSFEDSFGSSRLPNKGHKISKPIFLPSILLNTNKKSSALAS